MESWRKELYESIGILFHSDDELMHYGVKGMKWGKRKKKIKNLIDDAKLSRRLKSNWKKRKRQMSKEDKKRYEAFKKKAERFKYDYLYQREKNEDMHKDKGEHKNWLFKYFNLKTELDASKKIANQRAHDDYRKMVTRPYKRKRRTIY